MQPKKYKYKQNTLKSPFQLINNEILWRIHNKNKKIKISEKLKEGMATAGIEIAEKINKELRKERQ